MTTKLVNFASNDGQIIKSGLSDGRRAIFLPSVAEFAYDWLRIDGYLGNLGSNAGAEIRTSGLRVHQTFRRLRQPTGTAACEHPAGIWKGKFQEILEFFSSWVDPVGTLFGEQLEDDAAEVSAEGTDGLVVPFALGAFFLVVAL